MNLSLFIVEPGACGKWKDTLVPDVRVNVEAQAGVAVESDEVPWCDIVTR
jgi:hypothetical protein